MSTEIESQLKRCFELLAKIKSEYPEGEFDREMLHGDMDFRYRQIKEEREELEAFPRFVREFARFKDALSVPEEAVKRFFQLVLREPERFSALVGLNLRERQEKVEQSAGELGTTAKYLNELLARTRLSSILTADYKFNELYGEVISSYLML